MGAESHEQFWKSWAPYWELLEDRHFGNRALTRVLPFISSPVLVSGAGQGIAVHALHERHIAAVGIDRDREMLAMAKRRRGLEMVCADAAALPFPSDSFTTVIVSSGVVDYGQEDDAVSSILGDSLRVLRPGGELLVAYYRLEPELERAYRSMGVIVGDVYHLGRLFEIADVVRSHLLRIVPLAKSWTGRSTVETLVAWMKIGVFRPPSVREEERQVEGLLAMAGADGVSRADMIASVPKELPYWSPLRVRRALADAGLGDAELIDTGDCTVARYRRPPSPSVTGGKAGTSSSPGKSWHIRTEGVRKRYPGADRDAVKDLNLSVERGTVFGMLGPNGAGKTTSLSMLSGLLEPDEGTLRFGSGLSHSQARQRMGLVPQDLALYPKLTARENMVFFGMLYGMSGASLDRRCEELLELVGLSDRSSDRAERFSTGMKRRLNLAVGLVHHPDTLLLDEPTVGIDPQSRNRIFELVEELARQGVTILYTTHYMEEAQRLCHRLAIMDHGEILLEDAPKSIVDRLGTYRVELTVGPHARSFVAAVEAIPGVSAVTTGAGTLSVAVPDADTAMSVLRRVEPLADEQGVAASLRKVEEPSLENVFLSLTGRSMRDEME